MFCQSPFEFDSCLVFYQCDAINNKHLVLVSGLLRDVKVLFHLSKNYLIYFESLTCLKKNIVQGRTGDK